MTSKALNETRKTSKAEFQPYLTFSERIELDHMEISRFDGSDEIVGATAIKSNHHIQISPTIRVMNKGKTPATDLFTTYIGKITNRTIDSPKAIDRKIVSEAYNFFGSDAVEMYLGLDEDKPVKLGHSIVYDRVLESKFIEDIRAKIDDSHYNSFRRVSWLNAYCCFAITLSFSDQFSKNRRAFHVTYHGKIDENWVKLTSIRELLHHEDAYVDHQKQFDEFIEGSKHQDTPEA